MAPPTAKQVMAAVSQPVGPQDLIKKWSPLLDGLGKHKSELVAVALEREAKYLNALQDSGELSDPTAIGRWLKFFFPLICRAASQITILDLITFDSKEELESHVLDIVKQEFEALLLAEAKARPGLDFTDGGPELEKHLSGLAKRLTSSF